MSPDMCPDIYGNIDVSEDEVQLHNPIPDEIVKQYKELKASEEFILNFKLKACHCALCRHNYLKIGLRKAIKWNSKMYNKYKKDLKRLRDKGIRSGMLHSENELEKQYAVAHEMMLYHLCTANELRFMRKQGRAITDLHK